MEEKELYRRGEVVITPSTFTVAGRNYTVKDITSIAVETIFVNRVPLNIIFVVGTLIMMIKGMFFVGAAILTTNIFFYVMMRDEYSVRISIGLGLPRDCFIARDRDHAEEIAQVLSDAVNQSAYSNYIAETHYINIRPDFLAYKL